MQRRFKKLVSIILAAVILLIAGCTSAPSEPFISDSGNPSIAPSESLPIMPSETSSIDTNPPVTATIVPSETTSTNTDALDTEVDMAYNELMAEFEKNAEIKQLQYLNHDPDILHWTYYSSESRRCFEEMLYYRQSLDDFNEYMRFPNVDADYAGVLIDAKPIFSVGETSYRIITFDAGWPPMTYMYIQIFDDEYLETHLVETFVYEGGGYSNIAYCDFHHQSGRTYLIIVKKVVHLVVRNISPEYHLVNYELNGRDLRNYNALHKGSSDSTWTIINEFYDNDFTSVETVTRILLTAAYTETLSQDVDGQISFEGNKLTITMENDARDEISFLFVDGFWEILASVS